MADFKNEFSWSFSRDRLFVDCRRAYYFNYYAAWGGWDIKAPELARKAYLLKNLRNIDAWIGDIIHQLLKWILNSRRSKKIITAQLARQKAKEILIRTWEQSRSQQWKKNIKHNLNLFEHYYNREPGRDILAQKLQKITKSLTAFYSLDLLSLIDQLSSHDILAIDELDNFQFNNTKIYAIPDFAFRKGQRLYIYDWKTGKPSDKDCMQLSCYILYAQQKWNEAAENISIVPVYLSQPDMALQELTPVAIATIQHYILESIAAMKAVLSDTENNIINPELCPKTNETWRCQTCKFQEICLGCIFS